MLEQFANQVTKILSWEVIKEETSYLLSSAILVLKNATYSSQKGQKTWGEKAKIICGSETKIY